MFLCGRRKRRGDGEEGAETLPAQFECAAVVVSKMGKRRGTGGESTMRKRA